MVVVSGSSAGGLASTLAEELGWSHAELESRRFPDAEGYVRIPDECIEAVRDGPCVLVSNTYPDTGIVETMMLLEALQNVRRGELSNLTHRDGDLPAVGSGLLLAVPYFGYSRQDKRFQPGEVISARLMAQMLTSLCDGLILLDIHAPQVFNDLSVPVAFTSAMPEVSEHLAREVRPDFILSPDKGAIERATAVAEQIGCGFSYLEKKRIDAHTIEHTPKDLDVDGCVVAIVDDMISTGGTIIKASEALHRQGATSVHAACTHGLFTGSAISRLDRGVDGVHATDSLSNPRGVVSAAPALARGVQEILQLGMVATV